MIGLYPFKVFGDAPKDCRFVPVDLAVVIFVHEVENLLQPAGRVAGHCHARLGHISRR